MSKRQQQSRQRPGGRRAAFVAIAASAAATLGLAAGAYVYLRADAESRPWARPGDPGDPAQVALGQLFYSAQCASCHGDRLQGQPNWQTRKPDGKLPAPPHDATGHTWHHADQQLFQLTKNGLKHMARLGYVSDMPAYEGVLTDRQIWAVLAFIKDSWPADIRERQARISQRH
jgi:mono/diheme cytochrome c family protein